MLTFQDKEQQWESFRDGPQFGMHTWTTLQFFDANMRQAGSILPLPLRYKMESQE